MTDQTIIYLTLSVSLYTLGYIARATKRDRRAAGLTFRGVGRRIRRAYRKGRAA